MMALLDATIARIREPQSAVLAAAREREALLTKPPGSLGRLEELAVQLAGIAGTTRPRLDRRVIVIMAGDHGVTAEGVSAYPAAVTRQMVANFLRGGAAINALGCSINARITVVDVGVAADLPEMTLEGDRQVTFLARKIGYGTANAARGPAMSRADAVHAIEVGLAVVEAEIARGCDILGVGEMGIGNTTSASAIVSAMTGAPAAHVTGSGTGVAGEALANKIAVVERMLATNAPDPADPLAVLASVGGYEIAGIVGLLLGAAAAAVPVVLDGFITGAAALIAVGLSPALRAYLIAGHRSVEPGHAIVLERLALAPLLDLGLRLGEGTGAALAIGLLDGAARHLAEMATFAEAGITRADE